jgi:hypothetical protein
MNVVPQVLIRFGNRTAFAVSVYQGKLTFRIGQTGAAYVRQKSAPTMALVI